MEKGQKHQQVDHVCEVSEVVAGPGDIKKKKELAISQFNNGQLMEARQICEELRLLDPADPVIVCLLGMVYGSLNQFHKSIQFTRKAIEIDPDYVNAHYNLGIALQRIGELKEAAGEFEYVIARRADNIQALFSLGNIRRDFGEYQQAAECYRRIQQLDPGNLDAVAGEAEVFEKQGKDEYAYGVIQPYLKEGAGNAEIVRIHALLAGKRGDADVAIALLEQIIESDENGPDARMSLHFKLGDLYDRVGNYDDAFHHYEAGNQLKGIYFDSYQFRNDLNNTIEAFGESNISRFPRSGYQSDLPLFIVGMPRSGTSLVEQILASHRDIHGAGELGDIGLLVEKLQLGMKYGYYGLDFNSQITVGQLDVAANDYLENLRRLSPAAQRITDKMPSNFLHLGFIELLFPNARIIHCKRNALDTCLSGYFKNFHAGHAYTFKLEDVGRYYLGYRELMEHWKRVLQLPIHEVEYEELVGNPEREIRKLVEFSGLQWDENCLSHEDSSRVTRTASYDQANKPIYRKSMGRWRNYQRHIGPLIKELDKCI